VYNLFVCYESKIVEVDIFSQNGLYTLVVSSTGDTFWSHFCIYQFNIDRFNSPVKETCDGKVYQLFCMFLIKM